MNINGNFDDRYNYYFLGMKDLNCVDICLNDNLVISDDNGVNNSLVPYTHEVIKNGLEKSLEKFSNNNNYDKVFVIKVPSYYIGWIHRNGIAEAFVPILMSNFNVSTGNKEISVISNLVNGVYINDSKEYLCNENYNPLYDPSGLQFTDEQIINMYKYGYYDLYQRAIQRKKYSYDELKLKDDFIHVWDKTMKYYNSGKFKKNVVNIKRRILKKVGKDIINK